MRSWTALRETYGETADSSHPVGRLISAQPDLRGLLPIELAHRLGIPLAHAQAGILTLASECFPKGSALPPGESFDSLVVLAGRPMQPVELLGTGRETRTVPSGAPLRSPFRFRGDRG